MVDSTVAEDRRDFYVYVIFRPNGVPCYVGKGRGNRWRQHAKASHNLHLRRIFAKAGGSLPTVHIRESLTNAEACAIEIAFIRAIGRQIDGGPLVNITEGGEGQLGHSPSTETREKRRQKLKGRRRPSEVIEMVRLAALNRGASWREKQRASHAGYHPTEDARFNMSVAALARGGKTHDDLKSARKLTKYQRMLLNRPPMTASERSAAQTARNVGNNYGIGNKRTPDGQARVSAAVAEANRRRVASPEYRRLRSEIAKRMWANRKSVGGQESLDL